MIKHFHQIFAKILPSGSNVAVAANLTNFWQNVGKHKFNQSKACHFSAKWQQCDNVCQLGKLLANFWQIIFIDKM